MTKFAASAALALAAIVFAGSSAHAEELTLVTKRIVYHRADLATPQGAERMLARLARVSRALCRQGQHGTMNVIPTPAEIACEKAAVARAVADVDAPLVTAAFERPRSRGVTFARR